MRQSFLPKIAAVLCGFFFITALYSAEKTDDETPDEHFVSAEPFDMPFLFDSTAVFYQPRFRYAPSQYLPIAPIAVTAEPGIHKTRLGFTVAALASANIYAYQQFKNIWWDYPTSPFHLYRGWRQTEGWYDFGPDDSLWHHMDKFGHYYVTRTLSLFFSDTAQWIGFDESSSRWLGALTSWLFYLQIEIFDGQFEQWGFSLGDLTANTAGAFMPVLCHHVPALQNFTFKLSYAPKEIQLQQYMIEDYAGMTYWLTANPQNAFAWIDPLWPNFLNLALGYSVTQKAHGEIELFLSLDYDLTALQTRSSFWNRVLYYLNFIHLPAPAIKFRPTTAYYLLYY